MRKLSDWISSFIESTEHSEAPLQYRIWVGISCIASCLERKCYLIWSGRLYPNMFVVLIGNSGVRKGTAMIPGLSLLQEVGVNISANAITRQALIRSLVTASKKNPITDKVGLPIYHASITVFWKEMTVFLGYQNNELRSDLCDWYDCDNRWSYETISRDREEVNGVWVNLIAATTPDSLEESLPKSMIGSGLTARIIFVYSDREDKLVWNPFINKEDSILRTNLVSDLRAIRTLQGEFTYTNEFLNRYKPWYEDTRNNPPIKDPRFASYINRRADHLLKLCMVSSASRNNSLIIDESDFIRASEILSTTEVNMPRVWAGVGNNPLAGSIEKIISYIAYNGTTTYKKLYDNFYRDVSSRDLDQILLGLQTRGKIVINQDGTIKYKLKEK